MRTQVEKCAIFRALHERSNAFIIPNPWDLGSLRIFENAGFEAVATTSAGFAFTEGKRDGEVGREAMLAHAASLAAATDLPVSADLENGFADEPDGVAGTVRLAAAAGLAGCSIEDLPRGRSGAQYPLEHARERVRAAAQAARSLPFPFTITARAENYLAGNSDLADTIARLRAFEDAGADVLYAPGLRTKEEIAAVVRALRRPVNVLMGLPGVCLTLDELTALGVKRISVGSTVAHAAYGAAYAAAREMRHPGNFSFAETWSEVPGLGALLS